MQQKATEKIKHICSRNTPTRGQSSPPPQTPVCMSACVCVCFVYLLMMRDFMAHILHAALCPVSQHGLHRGIDCALWIISCWRSWLVTEQHKNRAQLQLPSHGPDHVTEDILGTQNRSQGYVEGVQSKQWALFTVKSLQGVRVSPTSEESYLPTHREFVCINGLTVCQLTSSSSSTSSSLLPHLL